MKLLLTLLFVIVPHRLLTTAQSSPKLLGLIPASGKLFILTSSTTQAPQTTPPSTSRSFQPKRPTTPVTSTTTPAPSTPVLDMVCIEPKDTANDCTGKQVSKRFKFYYFDISVGKCLPMLACSEMTTTNNLFPDMRSCTNRCPDIIRRTQVPGAAAADPLDAYVKVIGTCSGEKLMQTTAPSASECARLCSTQDACEAFRYSSLTHPTLKYAYNLCEMRKTCDIISPDRNANAKTYKALI